MSIRMDHDLPSYTSSLQYPTPVQSIITHETIVGENDVGEGIEEGKGSGVKEGRRGTVKDERSGLGVSLSMRHTDPFQVYLTEEENPQNQPKLRKWLIVFVISMGGLCVACASSMASFTENGIAKQFGVSIEVAILSISLYIEGLGVGPLVFGPLSELYGRNLIYRWSYFLFFVFTFPVAFAPNISVHLIFRFVCGFCGSAFLSVAGGTVSDLFDDRTVSTPMAIYTLFPFIGPVLGPLFSGFINQGLNWRWTFYVLLIWAFAEMIAIILVVPETYIPVLLKKKAKRLRRGGEKRWWAPLERQETNLLKELGVSCYRPFQLIVCDRMALLLDVWSALVLGILYLTFQAFPVIFMGIHGFNMQMTGLTFTGIGLGMLIGISTQPYWNRFYKRIARKNNGRVTPETRLVMGQYGAICVPLGLFWMAFTTYRGVPWILPILGSIPFGTGIYFVFDSVFTYLVTAYRPIAASAMASNSFMRSTFAAVFPLFAHAMYRRFGTVGATALLAGLTTLMAPLPFVFRRMGGLIRQRSRFAHH